jgi:hypothetical protein
VSSEADESMVRVACGDHGFGTQISRRPAGGACARQAAARRAKTFWIQKIRKPLEKKDTKTFRIQIMAGRMLGYGGKGCRPLVCKHVEAQKWDRQAILHNH